MVPGVLSLRRHYKELSLPVVIMAGDRDKIVFMRRAKQLHAEINGSVFHIIKGAGHMSTTWRRAGLDALESVAEASGQGAHVDEPRNPGPLLMHGEDRLEAL